ncbi:glycosyltransferase family 4 protein [Allorhizobium sp. NPDC080224]|uniref:glycosyltransferase family 4 protein n=1 Tax=Allorhizobium sp. NPDC080224 TaxID=3390547 RepID=UPI003D02B5C5
MHFLFCSEFYFPSIGGVQEVMRQIAERLVQSGHEVTVATTRLANRDFDSHNGVRIVEFGITGNLVRGMDGELDRYQDFVRAFDGDAIMIKAAQQWTFDALWPVLDEITCRKVFIPCGFSGLYEPSYREYFEALPEVLRKFDHLIFYAEQYRDVDFARKHGISNFSILPNGASEIEFGVERDREFRTRHGIPADSAVLLTVGSLTGVKGHRELLEAFVRLRTERRHVTFIMNGNAPPGPVVVVKPDRVRVGTSNQREVAELCGPYGRLRGIYEIEGLTGVRTLIARRMKRLLSLRFVCGRVATIWSEEGWIGIRMRLLRRIGPWLDGTGLMRFLPASAREASNPLSYWKAEAHQLGQDRLLLTTDFDRRELVQAYMAADLFVFASNIEYSPLVLYETVAAGTPFLSVPVGNAEEIAAWTGAGIICKAEKDERGYTRAAPPVLAAQIAKVIEDPAKLSALGRVGQDAWRERFTWAAITKRYEAILIGSSSSDCGR